MHEVKTIKYQFLMHGEIEVSTEQRPRPGRFHKRICDQSLSDRYQQQIPL